MFLKDIQKTGKGKNNEKQKDQNLKACVPGEGLIFPPGESSRVRRVLGAAGWLGGSQQGEAGWGSAGWGWVGGGPGAAAPNPSGWWKSTRLFMSVYFLVVRIPHFGNYALCLAGLCGKGLWGIGFVYFFSMNTVKTLKWEEPWVHSGLENKEKDIIPAESKAYR